MTGTQWLTDDEQRAWRTYVAMSTELTAALGRQLAADSALSLADFEVLVNLTDQPNGRMRAFALAKALDWEKSRLSHHLGRMRRRGLVNRTECPVDARGSFIEITAEGRRAIEHAAPKHVETVRELFLDRLGSEQVAALERICLTVLDRLRIRAGDDRCGTGMTPFG
jgi:DNA-binding MarR family transcriptional regulator